MLTEQKTFASKNVADKLQSEFDNNKDHIVSTSYVPPEGISTLYIQFSRNMSNKND